MTPYLLMPKERRGNIWVLHHEVRGTLKVRDRYKDFQCYKCGKIDEPAALKFGLEPDVRISSKFDYTTSQDGFVIMSQKLSDLLERKGIGGFFRYPFGASGHIIAWPKRGLTTNLKQSGVEGVGRRCPICRRFWETRFLPSPQAMKLPNESVLFTSNIVNERRQTRLTWYMAMPQVVGILRRNKISGVDFEEST